MANMNGPGETNVPSTSASTTNTSTQADENTRTKTLVKDYYDVMVYMRTHHRELLDAIPCGHPFSRLQQQQGDKRILNWDKKARYSLVASTDGQTTINDVVDLDEPEPEDPPVVLEDVIDDLRNFVEAYKVNRATQLAQLEEEVESTRVLMNTAMWAVEKIEQRKNQVEPKPVPQEPPDTAYEEKEDEDDEDETASEQEFNETYIKKEIFDVEYDFADPEPEEEEEEDDGPYETESEEEEEQNELQNMELEYSYVDAQVQVQEHKFKSKEEEEQSMEENFQKRDLSEEMDISEAPMNDHIIVQVLTDGTSKALPGQLFEFNKTDDVSKEMSKDEVVVDPAPESKEDVPVKAVKKTQKRKYLTERDFERSFGRYEFTLYKGNRSNSVEDFKKMLGAEGRLLPRECWKNQ